MQRVARCLVQASEVLFVDATSNCDVQNHKLYFFATHSPAGGIPVGCIISSSQKVDVFNAGVEGLIEIMPIKISPAVILTDDDMGERNVLKKTWPHSTLLLCTFHVLKACWKWLKSTKNKIKQENVQDLYKLFRNILMSTTEKDLEMNKNIFSVSCNYPKFKEYVENMIVRIETWCLFHRRQYECRGADTNNYVEVMFRLFKEITLERINAFNLCQLADFVTTSFEFYIKQRILDVILDRLKKQKSKRYEIDEKDITAGQVVDMGKMQYAVVRNNVMLGVTKRNTGKICKHQAAIIKLFYIDSSVNVLSNETKRKLYFIATGKEANENLLEPLLVGNVKSIYNVAKTENERPPDHVCYEIYNQINSDPPVQLGIPSDQEVLEVKEKWKVFSEIILKNLDDDTASFYPAVKIFLANRNKFAQPSESLLSGLYTAFKYSGKFANYTLTYFIKTFAQYL
ncbi:hypothetical protein RI129_004550 [Pyrocoelia pectoralis]|uniref:MULE transposase domain-containing protein n=1 Tax=Pyrocoelia pectoralis TaxID=417401 RepID=A0AAN7ZR06_9COLE